MINTVKYNSLLLIISIIFIGFSQISFAQNTKTNKVSVSYNGIVKDSDGNPILNAIVYGNQGEIKEKTNSDGIFFIKANPDSYLLIEADGFNYATISTTGEIHESF